jgi:enoyl-[acyl-carrier protein] reductase I
LRTRAASGIDRFEELLKHAAARAPKRRLVSIEEVGAMTTFLVSDAASALTGQTIYVDAGYHILG